MPSNYDELRYLKRQNISNSVDVMASYVSDYIRAHGIDVEYFRKYNSFYSDSVSADLVLGEEPAAEYTVSADMVVFSEVMADSYLLNKFGIQNEMEVEISIAIRDFQEQFRSILGVSASLDCLISTSGSLDAGILTGLINTDELYATASAHIDESTIFDSIVFDVVTQPRPKDLLFRASTNYNYYESELIGYLTGSFIETTGSITGYASGTVPYYHNYADNQAMEDKLRPQPEDFFRLKGYGIGEEWEITDVRDKNLMATGFNPMFGAYVFNLSAIRRMASHEVVMGGEGKQQETFTADKLEQIDWIESETDNIVSGSAASSFVDDSNIYGI